MKSFKKATAYASSGGGFPPMRSSLGHSRKGTRLAKDTDFLFLSFEQQKGYPYVWNLGGPRRLRATVHEPVETEGKSIEELKTILRTTFEQELEEYGISNETQQGRD